MPRDFSSRNATKTGVSLSRRAGADAPGSRWTSMRIQLSPTSPTDRFMAVGRKTSVVVPVSVPVYPGWTTPTMVKAAPPTRRVRPTAAGSRRGGAASTRA